MWGSWPTDDTFEAGESSLSLMLSGEDLPIFNSGSAIGLDEDQAGRAIILLPMFIGGPVLYFYRTVMQLEEVVSGATFDLAEDRFECSLLSYDTQTDSIDFVASCIEGRLNFMTAGTRLGDIVRGNLEVTLWGQGAD